MEQDRINRLLTEDGAVIPKLDTLNRSGRAELEIRIPGFRLTEREMQRQSACCAVTEIDSAIRTDSGAGICIRAESCLECRINGVGPDDSQPRPGAAVIVQVACMRLGKKGLEEVEVVARTVELGGGDLLVSDPGAGYGPGGYLGFLLNIPSRMSRRPRTHRRWPIRSAATAPGCPAAASACGPRRVRWTPSRPRSPYADRSPTARPP